MIVSVLWISISAIIIHSLKLVFNTATILSVLTGVVNNILLVLLAGCLYKKRSNILTKTVYFLSYFFTILIFYSDTLYFFVTSTHIERVVFNNLNIYSITGVLYAADKLVLIGILASFFFLIMLFRIPKKFEDSHIKTAGVAMIAVICITANLINIATSEAYPKVLYAGGFDEEGEIEKSRNLSRELISKSVTVNLVREFLRNEEKLVINPNQFQREVFSENEKRLLSEFGIMVDEKPDAFEKAFPYEKVIVIVAESFHRDYLHFYNSHIPVETTQFLDGLLAKYPHLDNYYTSNRPTTQGLNSMFLYQMLYSDEQGFENNATLFKTLESNGYDTVFMDATSQYYNDEFRAYKKRFGMHIYRAKEDLEKQGYRGSAGWGFHNDVMYEETLRILDQNRSNKVFIVTKTIDSHQPYPYCGFSDDSIPTTIKEKYNLYLRAIYWENICLQKFFHDLEERNLMDDKTLVIVTSDHNPHPSQDDNYKSLGTDDLPLSLAPIPLIFVSKNLQPFDNFNNAIMASQIDFAPTL
jgi:phosphoglycerol transferase MdoB-like AlkP superfamily enzyme